MGITSAVAAGDAQGGKAVGYAEASTLLGLTGNLRATWAGQSVDATSVVLQVTSYGDANLDGAVTADDYAILDRAFAKSLSNAYWTDGDFNYDGAVNAADYLLIDRAYLAGHPAAAPTLLAQRDAQFGPAYVADLASSVPEPASVGLGAAVSLGLGARRRRSR